MRELSGRMTGDCIGCACEEISVVHVFKSMRRDISMRGVLGLHVAERLFSW